jgi:ligand-binding sensor domain-containing protein
LFIVTIAGFLSLAKSQSSFRISIEQGLHTNAITDITRDRNNNMWIGSYNGLYKHEGTSIKAYTTTGKGPTNLTGLEMHTVYEDKLGFIWAGTTSGLDKINPHTYEVTHYPIRSKDSNSSFVGYIYSVFQDDENYIWICTDAAMFRMNYTTGEYVAIPVAKDETGMPDYAVGYNCGVRAGKGIWIHTYDGMVYYEYASKKFYHRYHNPHRNPVFDIGNKGGMAGSQSGMETDDKGNIWYVATKGLLACFNWQTNKLDTFSFQHPANAWVCCYSVKADGQGNIWLGFRHGGLLHFNVKDKKFTPILFKERNSLISSNYIYSLERDYTGNIWAATDNGIDVIDYYNQAVLQRQLSTQPDFINLQYTTGDFTYDGQQTVYIPFYKYGFIRYNLKTDEAESFTGGTDKKYKGVAYVIPQNKNTVWGAREKKLISVNLTSKVSTEVNYSSVLPAVIEKYPGDVIWYWRQSPTSVYIRKSSGVFLHVRNDSVEVMKGYAFKKNTTLAYNQQAIWCLTEELNLVKKPVSGQKPDTIRLQEMLKKTGFSFSNPRDMTDDGESIWMTGQNGLLRYSYQTKNIKTYSTQEGLSHSSTYSLVTDNLQRVWAASIGGIDVYDKNSGLFKPVISFPASTYMDAFGSAMKIGRDTLVFHGGNKLFIIQPEVYFNTKQQQYDLQIHELQINGRSINMTDIKKLSSLKHTDNKLLLRFGLLRFDRQYDINYWYKLKSSDEWVLLGNKTELTLNELQPGGYTLTIKATNVAGDKILNEKNVSFHIKPPFWQTWWFRLLIAIISLLAVYYFFRSREKNIRTKAAIKQQMAELEGKALRAQMNPHFIFNSLNAIQELIVTENYNGSYQYLSKFSKLLRMVLNNSEKNMIALQDEIDMNRLYLELESLRFKQSFHYSITTNEKIDTDTVQFPSLLLQPFIENAIWHGLMHKEDEKRLTVFFTETNGLLQCTIEDNGIGRAKAVQIKAQKIGAAHFQSKGTELAMHRVQALQQLGLSNASVNIIDLFDEQNVATGTRVVILIPKTLKQ